MASTVVVQPLSDGALIKDVRTLDQSSAESIPETLAKLWTHLVNSTGGPFHAPEESILRWLLKNMNGPAATTEQFRRYPLAWNIMGSVFRRMPLFSLAKSLADRRFIPILQQTLKDISTKAAESSEDIEMVDAGSDSSNTTSRKRKRSAADEFDLNSLRKSHGCLKSAESVFDTLQILLARLEPVETETQSNSRMGAEHVKSLFSSPAKESMEILRPMLAICDLALTEEESEPRENQSSWIATFASLWNFHLQSSDDALQVAMSLYPTGCIILTKTQRLHHLTIDPQVKATWTRDLRRFFITNMILPARAAFLNRKDIGMLTGAVEVTSLIPTISSPVLFSLAVKASSITDDASAKKNHEDWTQKVFETLEEPLRAAEATRRNNAMRIILDTALENKTSLSLSSLRTVSKLYTTSYGLIDLKLVSRVANLDIDVFLISDEGHKLLDDILHQITNLNDTAFEALGDAGPAELVISLAKGFARGRDLSGFLKKWLEVLADCLGKDDDYSLVQGIWSSQDVVKTVSGLLESSMTSKQLLAVLKWLDSQDHSAKAGALLVVLDAISHGITKEEYVDAVNTKLFDTISKIKLRALDAPRKALWWRIAGNTVSWSTLEQAGSIWTQVESDLNKTLKKSDLADPATLAAFHCCSTIWLANYPGGKYESDASAMACAFLKRLGKDARKTPTEDISQDLKYFESTRLTDMVIKQPGAIGEFLQPLLAHIDKGDGMDGALGLVLYNEANLHNYKYLKGLIEYAINALSRAQDNNGGGDTQAITGAIQVLLDVPLEALSREQRERTMKLILHLITIPVSQEQKPQSIVVTKRLLSLMIQTMEKPTFYEEMKFADLVAIGSSLVVNIQASVDAATDSGMSDVYDILKLYESLALATVRQMTLNVDKRERTYLAEAASTVLSWPTDANLEQVHRYILSRSLTTALESSKGTSQSTPNVDLAAIKQHMALMVANFLNAHCVTNICPASEWLHQGLPTCFALSVLDQLDGVEPAIVRKHSMSSREELDKAGEALCSQGVRGGWRLKALLYTCFGKETKAPLEITVDRVTVSSKAKSGSRALSFLADTNDISDYIDVVVASMDQDTRMSSLENLTRALSENQTPVGSLFVIRRLLRNDSKPSDQSSAVGNQFDLASLHSTLAKQLPRSRSTDEFSLIAQILHTLLDKKASSMKQWNIEVTLSTVAAICAGGCAATEIKSSAKTYEWLCRLVEVIIKRHRLRLEGHFHLLVKVLQSLLGLLIANPSQQKMSAASRARHAKHYARLLTLVCEPSVASVTRGQPNGLDSATDAAKRSAGQHMYIVLMLYVKLQLENSVPRDVREALLPGVYSVLDITTQEGYRIVNEAVDGSGRAIFRELYKQYRRFGKWSGV